MSKSDDTRAAVDRNDDDRMWPVSLRLRRSHWHGLEDVLDRTRRAGVRYRPDYSTVLRGLLDAVLPHLKTGVDFKELGKQTEGQTQAESKVTVSAWIKQYMSQLISNSKRSSRK